MAKRRNERLRLVPDICPLCGQPSGFLKSNKPRFKASVAYNSGFCKNCQPNVDRMVNDLANGGILLVCLKCHCVNTTMVVEAQFKPFLDQMPNGTLRLELPYCPNCKEANDAKDTGQVQSPANSAEV